MEEKASILTYFKNWKGRKGRLALVFVAIIGVLLLLFGGLGGTVKSNADYTAQTEEYRRNLEEELTALCAGVAGVGKVELYITIEHGEEYVWAADESSQGNIDYVMQSGEGLLLYRKTPTVAGVAVVCDGGADAIVVNELSRLLHASLGIPYSRISISPSNRS